MNGTVQIHEAVRADLTQINDIFNWHTEHGFSTFGQVTSLQERTKWFERFDAPEHIALVAKANDRVLGLACSFAYRGGGVFKHTVETSIYLAPDSMGKGLGSRLYRELLARLEKTRVHRVVAGVALPNEGSVALHRKFGFEEIGVFDDYAFYKGAYRSSLWLQKRMPESTPPKD